MSIISVFSVPWPGVAVVCPGFCQFRHDQETLYGQVLSTILTVPPSQARNWGENFRVVGILVMVE